jgi:uncharacterized protein
MRPPLILALLAAAVATTSEAASFDCGTATSRVEQLICGDRALSALDDELAAAYKTQLAQSIAPEYLRQQQRRWLKKRDACSHIDCIRNAYHLQLARLAAHASLPAAVFQDEVVLELHRQTNIPLEDLHRDLANCEYWKLTICTYRDFVGVELNLKKLLDAKLASLDPSCRSRLSEQQTRWERSRDKRCEELADRENAGPQIYRETVTDCRLIAIDVRTSELEAIKTCSDIPR